MWRLFSFLLFALVPAGAISCLPLARAYKDILYLIMPPEADDTVYHQYVTYQPLTFLWSASAAFRGFAVIERCHGIGRSQQCEERLRCKLDQHCQAADGTQVRLGSHIDPDGYIDYRVSDNDLNDVENLYSLSKDGQIIFRIRHENSPNTIGQEWSIFYGSLPETLKIAGPVFR